MLPGLSWGVCGHNAPKGFPVVLLLLAQLHVLVERYSGDDKNRKYRRKEDCPVHVAALAPQLRGSAQ